MDDNFTIGDKVILTYVSKFGTGRKAVANGTVTILDDDQIEVQVGRVLTCVSWDEVFGLRLA